MKCSLSYQMSARSVQNPRFRYGAATSRLRGGTNVCVDAQGIPLDVYVRVLHHACMHASKETMACEARGHSLALFSEFLNGQLPQTFPAIQSNVACQQATHQVTAH